MIFNNLNLLLTHDRKDPIFLLYLKILKIPSFAHGELVKPYLTNPGIYKAMIKYLKTGKNNIASLLNYSEEQLLYVTNPSIQKTKLIACPGSGKTRCILSRIHFMITHKMCHKDEVFAITFSRFASQEFHKRLKQLYPDDNVFNLKNFSTIDSLAKSILCLVRSHKSESVEILSIAFRNFLRETPASQLRNLGRLGKIHHLYVDEAQDLNETQYDILMLLQEKLGTIINEVGDPNQNIYQFRGSSDQYLLKFDATVFKLTINYRSTGTIINFFSALRPIDTGVITPIKPSGNKVKILNKPGVFIQNFIIDYIKSYKGDLSDIAIISSTRGIKTDRGIGLSIFFNLLKLHKIPFVQGYEESSNCDERQRRAISIAGNVNLITLHGTKGLEFKIVFFVDCYQKLFNIQPTEKAHNEHRYILFVASSRAIDELYICANSEQNGGMMNHWLGYVNPLTYETTGFRLPRLDFREESKEQIFSITELLGAVSTEQLNKIIDLIDYREEFNMLTKRVYADFRHIDRGKDESLFGIFVEELYYLQFSIALKNIPRELKLIKMLIDQELVIIKDESTCNYLKKQFITNRMTWNAYDLMKNQIAPDLRNIIESSFSRKRELYENVICHNQFAELVNLHLPDIKKAYDAYLEAKSYDTVLHEFFFLVVVMYAYEINHYFYITNRGIDKEYLLINGAEMFAEMDKFVRSQIAQGIRIMPKYLVKYKPLQMIGEIDYIEKNNGKLIISEIKTVKEINLKHILQVYLYHFCFFAKKKNPHKVMKIYNAKVKIINFLSGLEHEITIRIKQSNLFEFINILAEAGDLKWNKLNVVYDLETTGGINSDGFPEIIEIAMKDYQTEMIIFNKLIKPTLPITEIITTITGINNAMVANAISQQEFFQEIKKMLKRFDKNTFLAHNGKMFDDKIMRHYKLLPDSSEFVDTLSLVPIHCHEKLKGKSLSAIYRQLFNHGFNAHRAMSDVDALIKIMWYLKIAI